MIPSMESKLGVPPKFEKLTVDPIAKFVVLDNWTWINDTGTLETEKVAEVTIPHGTCSVNNAL